MNGIEMMMRSMGVNPDQIKSDVAQFAQRLEVQVKQLNESLAQIRSGIEAQRLLSMQLDAKLDRLLLAVNSDAAPELPIPFRPFIERQQKDGE